MELTKKEEELTKHCEDFCPIYDAIRNYDRTHKHRIGDCTSEMCEKIVEAYISNLRMESKEG